MGIGEAQRESWLETYPNSALGIDESFLKRQFEPLTDKKGNDFRLNTVREASEPDSNVLYLAVKNQQGKIRGFLHIAKHGDSATFEAIYLTKDAQGTGVAHELMHRALDFAGHLPMTVNVADYNGRAIHFYEDYGFVKQPNTTRIHHEKIPIMTMKRPATKGTI